MQFTLDIDGHTPLIEDIDARLRHHFPDFPPRYLILDPVSQMVMSLLGGRTKTHVSRAARANIIGHFRNWSEVRDADADHVFSLIRKVTWAEKKSRSIKSILTRLSDGSERPSLDHLQDMSVQRAHEWLENIKGIGPKIAAAVLNTSAGQAVGPDRVPSIATALPGMSAAGSVPLCGSFHRSVIGPVRQARNQC